MSEKAPKDPIPGMINQQGRVVHRRILTSAHPEIAVGLAAKELDATERIERLLAGANMPIGGNDEGLNGEDVAESLVSKGWKEVRPGVFVPGV